MKNFSSHKISIIGAGNVGSAIAFALTIKDVASQINLIDLDKEVGRGQAMDISDGLSFVETNQVISSSFKEARKSDIIIVTAGARQQPGETRLDLVSKNKSIMKSIFTKIGKLKPSAIIMVVSNPVDVLTQYIQSIVSLPASQVFGSGTTLDTSRLHAELSKHFDVSTKNIHGYVLGEHGDSEFVAWSSTTIGGVPIMKLKGFNKTLAKKIEVSVKQKAYKIIEKKGATFYGIGLNVANIIEAILYDQHLILPVSSRVKNWNGISNVCLGSLAVVGRKGIESHWPLNLSAEEKAKLKKSADILKSYQ